MPYLVNVDIAGIEFLGKHLSQSLTSISKVMKVLDEHGKMVQQRAVRNVSGEFVSYKGRTWVINRQTGKLARSIQRSKPNPLSVVVEASAEYASDVELGTRGPVDLKKTRLAGKVIPMPVSAAQTKALTSKHGDKIKTLFVGSYNKKQTSSKGFKANQKLTTTGQHSGTKGILFRRVPGPGGQGWIIPQRPGRPFMAEAGDYVAPLLAKAVEKAFAEFLTDPNP